MIFLTPIYSSGPCPRDTPPSKLVLWLFRWLAFRLMIGAGMSKVGGNSSACWRELTCTQTHYFTQPMPNPLAWWAHHLPADLHRFEVAITFFEQLVLPFGVLLPIRSLRVGSALLECCFQLAIVGTGNYAWINFIGVVPYLSLLDDGVLRYIFPAATVAAADAAAAAIGAEEEASDSPQPEGETPTAGSAVFSAFTRVRRWTAGAISLLLLLSIAVRSVDPVKELFSVSPWLHIYDDYFIVNSQGVFGFINSERVTLVLEFTHDDVAPAPPPPGTPPCADAKTTPFNGPGGSTLTCAQLAGHCSDRQHGPAVTKTCPVTCGGCAVSLEATDGGEILWSALDFMNLPGSLERRPYFNSPYHYRLDWEVWIHTTASYEGKTGPLPLPGFITELNRRIMQGDTDAMGLVAPQTSGLLLASDSQDAAAKLAAPTAIRARYYKYTFTDPGSDGWWKRERLSGDTDKLFLPPTDAEMAGKAPPRKSPPHRAWLLLMCTCGAAFTVMWMATGGSMSEPKWALLMLCQLLYCTVAFGVILLQDYPELRASLGPAAAYAERVGLKISPDDWAEAGAGYASVLIVSAAQAMGILTLGLKMRRAELPEEPEELGKHPEVLLEEAESERKLKEHVDNAGYPSPPMPTKRQQQERMPPSHPMDLFLIMSALLAGLVMTISRWAGDYSALL